MKKGTRWQPIFTTPRLRSQNWLMPTMILGAVFIHGAAFYLVQTTAPKSETTRPVIARFSVLNPENPQDRAALEWIENRDPAAIVIETEPPPQPPISVPYQPSYEAVLPRPIPIPKDENPLEHASFFPPGPVPDVTLSRRSSEPDWPELATKISVSEALAPLASREFIPPKIQGDIPVPSRFFVVQLPTENEKSIFLMESSGNDVLDEYARTWMKESPIAFHEAQSSGWVEFYWGADIWKKPAP